MIGNKTIGKMLHIEPAPRTSKPVFIFRKRLRAARQVRFSPEGEPLHPAEVLHGKRIGTKPSKECSTSNPHHAQASLSSSSAKDAAMQVRSSPEGSTSTPRRQSYIATDSEQNHGQDASRRNHTTRQQAFLSLLRRTQQDNCGPHPRTAPLHHADGPAWQKLLDKTIGKMLLIENRTTHPASLSSSSAERFAQPALRNEASQLSAARLTSAQCV
jgi:hypothetical protein